ncbi:MAG: adenylate/guanylate cyclase domain-containing protein [Acidimicrobiia bacterium]
MSLPQTRYAQSGDVSIAYQVFGDAPIDLVYVPGWVSNVELIWDDPLLSRFFRRLSSFARVITFDKRGTGLSDPVAVDNLPDLETRMDDLRAVMDASGSESATIFGHSEGGALSILFAATHPRRTDRLVLTGAYAKRVRSDDYPWAPTADERRATAEEVERTWGRSEDLSEMSPSRADDPDFQRWYGRYERFSASPRAAAALIIMNSQADVRSVLRSITVPTLLLYRVDDRDVSVEEGRYIADAIEGSRLVTLPGGDHLFWTGDTDQMLDEIEEFVTGEMGAADPDRRLVTVLFTDIVDSTKNAARLGDSEWRRLLERHHQVVRAELSRWNGVEVGTTGDGFLATFDGPARAIRCALSISTEVESLGLEVRCGVHTGMVEVVGDDVAGLAVHIGARVGAMASPGEVLVSSTVKDLVAGSGFTFEDRGRHELKGVPDTWQIYAATR